MTSRTLFLITGLSSLIVYILTLAPTITWRNDGVDSGDLVTAVAVGGVPHPPGYPTYLILGEVFRLLPFGDIAYRLNLLSATCAALSVVVIAVVIYQTLAATSVPQRQVKRESGRQKNLRWFCAASASLVLAFSGTFWSQAVIAEVYAPNLFFMALLLYGALQVKASNERWLIPGLSGLIGFGLGNHPSILFILPTLTLILKIRWRWQLIFRALLSFWLGLSIYLIIPIRAATSPPINWGMAVTWPNFLWLVSAAPYHQFLFTIPPEFFPARIATELHLLAKDFMWWGIAVGFLGLLHLIQRNRSLAYGSIVTFLLTSIYAIGYNTTDSYVYLLPAFLMATLWIGWGLHKLGQTLPKFVVTKLHRNFIAMGFAILPILSLLFNFSDQNISRDNEAYDYGQQSLQIVAPGAVIITEDDSRTFALWYSRYGLAVRSDVAIVNRNLLPYPWYRQTLGRTHTNLNLTDQAGRPLTTLLAFIEQNLSHSPIYLATTQPPLLEDYRLEPFAHLQRVQRVTGD